MVRNYSPVRTVRTCIGQIQWDLWLEGHRAFQVFKDEDGSHISPASFHFSGSQVLVTFLRIYSLLSAVPDGLFSSTRPLLDCPQVILTYSSIYMRIAMHSTTALCAVLVTAAIAPTLACWRDQGRRRSPEFHCAFSGTVLAKS